MAPKSIAVIGAGATGLLVAAELKNAGGGAAAAVAGAWRRIGSIAGTHQRCQGPLACCLS